MKRILLPLLLLAMLVPVVTTAEPITDASLEKIMELSGLNEQVAEFPGIIRTSMQQARQQGAQVPDDIFNEILQALETSVTPERFKLLITKQLKADLSEEQAQELVAWYETEPGSTITSAEVAASTPEAYQEMIATAQELFAQTERMELARRIDAQINATDMTMQIQDKTAIAVYTALMTALMPDEPFDISELQDELARQQPQLRANAEAGVLVSFVYSYRNLDIPTIETYISFLETDAARAMNASIIAGTSAAFDLVIADMAEALVAAAKARQPQTQTGQAAEPAAKPE